MTTSSGEIPELQALFEAGKEPHPGPRQKGLTRAGWALQKHAKRTAMWGDPTEDKKLCNERGQVILSEIVFSEETTWIRRVHNQFGDIVEGYLPYGRGARWSAADMQFIGFVEAPWQYCWSL